MGALVKRREFELVPLDCPTCGAGIEARGQDVVFYCTACRNGYRFEQVSRRLLPVEVAFVSLPAKEVDLYLPFWLLPATVAVLERQASGGSFSGLMRFFFGGDDTGPGSSQGTFATPAFQAPLQAVTDLTRRYTEVLPQLGEKLGERLVGGCFGVEDAQKLARYALVASEVNKADTLQRLRYEIEFGEPRLLGVPFVSRQAATRDAIFDIVV